MPQRRRTTFLLCYFALCVLCHCGFITLDWFVDLHALMWCFYIGPLPTYLSTTQKPVYPVHWDTAIIIKVANEVRTDDIIHRNLNVDTPAIKVDPDLQELRLSQVQQAQRLRQTADRFVDMIGESDSSDEPSDDDASRRLSMSDHHPLASSHHELKDEGKYEEEECEEEESEQEAEEEEEDEEEYEKEEYEEDDDEEEKEEEEEDDDGEEEEEEVV